MIYCPYTDREIRDDEASSEHVIPLSLGGVDGFELPVDRNFNSESGSKLEGALANEFLWALARTKFDARGHSGKKPFATVKKAEYGKDHRKVQVHFHSKDGLRMWDVRDGKMIPKAPSFTMSTSLNVDLPIRFTAKVSLAAGYFAYGDVFRDSVDHRQLRDVMNTDPAELDLDRSLVDLGLGHLTLSVDDYMRAIPDDPESPLFLARLFCSSVKGSVVILMPGNDNFGVFVGILGRYLAMLNVPANTSNFPNQEDFEFGHVMAVVDKKLRRYSWIDGLSHWIAPSI